MFRAQLFSVWQNWYICVYLSIFNMLGSLFLFSINIYFSLSKLNAQKHLKKTLENGKLPYFHYLELHYELWASIFIYFKLEMETESICTYAMLVNKANEFSSQIPIQVKQKWMRHSIISQILQTIRDKNNFLNALRFIY